MSGTGLTQECPQGLLRKLKIFWEYAFLITGLEVAILLFLGLWLVAQMASMVNFPPDAPNVTAKL